MDEKLEKRKRRVFTEEFKRDALALLEKSGKSKKEIETDLGIPQGAISRWFREAQLEGTAAFRGSGNAHPVQAEFSRMQREIQILKGERDLLKKAIALMGRDRG